MRLIVGVLCLTGAAAITQGLTSALADEQPERAAASRHYPGPPVWRVSKGDHELRLFGTLSAVPKDIKGSPAAVEHAIRDADELLLPPGVRAATGPAQLLRAWVRARAMSRNPQGKLLADVLPEHVYRRYAVLRDRYVRHSRHLEEQRPIVVAGRVYRDAVEHMGLVSGRDVQREIERAARRAGVETIETALEVDPEELLDHAARVPSEAELDCFAKVLGTIEGDDARLAARARAWALGDVAALRRFDYPDIQRNCLSYPGWPEAFGEALDAADEKWLDAAERALSANRTTFGTLDLRELMSTDGLLERLRERGYEVHAP